MPLGIPKHSSILGTMAKKLPTIEVFGPGVDFDIYEITPEDCRDLLDGESDIYEVMDRSIDLSDSLGFTEPYASDLIIACQASPDEEPEEIDLTPEEESEITDAKTEEVLTILGKCYLARVSLIRRNHWTTIQLDGDFDPSRLRITTHNPRLGVKGRSPDLEWASVAYADCSVEQFRSFDASSEFYVIDAEGECKELDF